MSLFHIIIDAARSPNFARAGKTAKLCGRCARLGAIRAPGSGIAALRRGSKEARWTTRRAHSYSSTAHPTAARNDARYRRSASDVRTGSPHVYERLLL